MILHAINGEVLLGMEMKDMMEMIQWAPRPLTLRFKTSDGNLPTKPQSPTKFTRRLSDADELEAITQ